MRNGAIAALLIVSILAGAGAGYLVGVNVSRNQTSESTTTTPTHIYVSAQPDALTISTSTFHYVTSLTNPNEVKVAYFPHLEVEMMPTQGDSIVYSRTIEFNMTFPLTLNPLETRIVYDGEIHLDNASNGTYWLQVIGQPTGSVVVLSEPTLVTLEIG